MKEVWKKINGFEDYQVSNFGYVKSYRKDKKNGCLLKLHRSGVHTVHEEKYGAYLCVELRNDNEEKTFKVHRLVAMAFLPNPNNLPQINHKNGIKSDNRVENLEWCSSFDNVFHSTNILHKDKYGKSKSIQDLKQHKNIKEKGKRKVYQRKRNYEDIKIGNHIDLSDKNNIAMLTRYGDIIATFKNHEQVCDSLGVKDVGTIIKCCNREKHYNFAHGYMWRFVGDLQDLEECKRRNIVQATETGICVKEYDDIFCAAKENDFDIIKLMNCVNGKSKTSFHYKWFFKDEYEEKTTNKWRPVVKFDINGEYICEYPCITDAAKENNAFISAIYLCCNNKRKTAGGFMWKYKDEYLQQK